MTSDQAIYAFMTQCGETLIRSGASSASTTKTILAISRTAGLQNVTVSVTLGQLTISDPHESDGVPRTLIHEVAPGTLDISWRSQAEEVIESYLLREISLEDASAQLRQEVETPLRDQWWWTVIGFGILGGGFSLLLGGDIPTSIGATLVSVLVCYIFRWLSRLNSPGIFSYALGGLAAVVASTAFCLLTGSQEVAICIVAALAARLAGIAAYGAVQDALTGWYLSATGRILDVVTCTAGLVSGVAVGIAVCEPLAGDRVMYLQTLAPETTQWIPSLLGAMLVSAGFSLSSGGRRMRLLVMTVLGGLGQLGYLVLGSSNVSPFLVMAVTAAAIGAVSVLVSRPLKLTSNAIMMVALLPLFPGMSIYQGLLGIVFGQEGASQTMLEAAGTTYCLCVGGIAGQFVVSELMWFIRRRQFVAAHPGARFDKTMVEEHNARDIMVPIFSKPFNTEDSPAVSDNSTSIPTTPGPGSDVPTDASAEAQEETQDVSGARSASEERGVEGAG